MCHFSCIKNTLEPPFSFSPWSNSRSDQGVGIVDKEHWVRSPGELSTCAWFRWHQPWLVEAFFWTNIYPQKWIHWKVMSAFLTLWSQFLDDSQIYTNLLLTATIWIIFLLLDVGSMIPQMIWMAQPPEPLPTIADSLLFQSQAQVRNWPVRNLQNWWFSGLVPSNKPA